MTRPGFIFEDETIGAKRGRRGRVKFIHHAKCGRRRLLTRPATTSSGITARWKNINALFSASRKQPGSVSYSLKAEIMNKCEELQFDLPLYFDGSLNTDERSTIDEHLPECPLCRQKLSEFEELSLVLRSIPRHSAPVDLVNAIRASVGAQLALSTGYPTFRLIERRRRWTDIWLMPSATGAIATLVIGFTLLSLTLSSSPVPLSARESSGTQLKTPVFLASNPDISPDDYVRSRFAVSGESPSVNPRGALVALTRSLVRGEMHDDEVVVVADVFSNGLARIAEVVEPSRDRKAVEELQKALGSDPSFAPFVPANLDQRSSDPIRVVLKIQSVNVSTASLAPTIKSKRSQR